MRRLLLGAVLAAIASHATAAAESVVWMLGKEAGTETVTTEGNETVVRYRYNDRGRGPEIEARWQLDAAGLPTQMRIRGVDYFKAPVDEQYDRSGSGSRWVNTAEQGESPKTDAFTGRSSPRPR